mgnify:FL=1|tara:strand:+ start:516 stop:758 length:243 start_codon:yes stop_codon:yes gene_type:complete
MNNLYTKYDLADKLRLSVSTIDNHMKEDKIEYLKIGKSVRFTENAVNNYLQQFDKKRYTAKVINDVGVKGLVNGLGTRTK